MSSAKQPLYYWDTCLFLAWLKDEERRSGEMAGVREVIRRSKKHEIVIMTSVLTYAEVLESKMPVGVRRVFSDFMGRLQKKSIDLKISKLAHDLRDFYAKDSSLFSGKKLKTPDALHIATAILYHADEFHTFDEGLLSLSENVGGHDLKICKPYSLTPELDLRRNPIEK